MAMSALKRLGSVKSMSPAVDSTSPKNLPAAAGPRRNSLMGKLGLATPSLSKFTSSKRSILLSPNTKKKNLNRVNFDLTVSLINFDETGAAMNTRSASASASASRNQSAGIVNKLAARLGLRIPNIFRTSSGIVRIIKRQLLVLAHLYTMWALPFDAVFGDFTETKTGMLVSFLFVLHLTCLLLTKTKNKNKKPSST